MIQFAMRWDRNRDPALNDEGADRFFLSLALVCADLAQHSDEFWLPRAKSDELAKAMAYALENLAADPAFEAAAGAAGVSGRTLARRFDEETNMSWQQFVRRARMIRAMELLCARDAKLIEIAQEVGFQSQSAFIAAFREFTGETPSGYRRRLQPGS
jgi:AraC-like DNA-binding protein